MRKRRVLALLLALSLVVSGNGMTVLAAEQGPDMPVLASQEETQETDDKSGESGETSGNTEESAKTDDKSEEGKEPSTEEKPSEEGETPENPEEGDPSGPEEDNDGQDGDQTEGEDGDQTETEDGSQTETEDGEDGKQEEEPGTEEQEPTVSENDVEETEVPEEESVEQDAAVRIMTFTDDAGLRITFDANEAEENAEKVTIIDGVLTGIDDSVEGVVDLREKEITSVGAGAFKSKTKITYVMLPKTVETLGAGAFEDCSALKGVSIPSRLVTVEERAFKGCTALTQIALPNSVSSIGANAFSGDSRLFMMHMRSAEYSKLQTIGASAFSGCSSLEFFCSDDSYNLPASITTIGNGAFENCASISAVDMSRDKIASLGENAYKGCTGMKVLTLSSRLEVIAAGAFAGCSGLERITFGNAVIDITTTIAGSAFQSCTGLSSIFLPEQVQRVCTGAFDGCNGLMRVEVKSGRTVLEANALPNENKAEGMCIVGEKVSMAAQYAEDYGIPFIARDDSAEKLYAYRALVSGYGTNTATKITMTVSTSKGGKDINTIVNGQEKGVAAGTTCYIFFNYPAGMEKMVELVKGSVKCNGEPADYKDGEYTFKMPVGGATVTAEFKAKGDVVTVDGDESTIEGRLSSEADYDEKEKAGRLKVGQSVRFYLINNKTGSEGRIPVSKVKYEVTPNSTAGVVKVFSDGTIKALKAGTASVMASVETTGRENGKNKVVTKFVTIIVENSGINHIGMLVEEEALDTDLKFDREENRIYIKTERLTRDYTFTLKAIAFSTEDQEGEMESAFAWKSSDTKVAKVEKGTTAAGASRNKITIPKNADGEATITVTATNADKTKVVQKFVVIAQNFTPRLTASKITVNPNQVAGATKLGIIRAYEKAADREDVKILDAKTKKEYGDFQLKLNTAESTDDVSIYNVEVREGLKETTYAVLVQTKVEGMPYQVPLSITVKSSLPNPTVSFERTQPKLNLFYAHSDIEFKPVIGRLGSNDEVVKYTLKPLTESGHNNYADDVKFTENFTIDEKTGVITQKSGSLLCNKSKKPVVSGYLVLSFKDYREKATKQYKITIPTQTVAPAYILDRTSDTFGTRFKEAQTVNLKLLDKKTKKPIPWDDDFTLKRGEKSTCDAAKAELVPVTETVDGVSQQTVGIRVTVQPNPGSGKLSMILENSKWAAGKSFTYDYTIKTDKNPAKLKLQKATITLNANCPEKAETFKVVSNQYDTNMKAERKFTERSTTRNEQFFEKLEVNCSDGENGTVSFNGIDEAKDVPNGNYQYDYSYSDDNGKTNKITLTVKVTRTWPTVTFKGTNAFNIQAWEKVGNTYKYVETSEMTVTAKNLTDGYTFDPDATFASVKFNTKGFEHPEDYFDFAWEAGEKATEGKIKISLKKEPPLKTYSLKMTPTYKNASNSIQTKNPVTFSVRVYDGDMRVRLNAKGKINLLNRAEEEKNGIQYTPVFTNLKDTVQEVRLLDADDGTQPEYDDEDRISEQFTSVIAEDGKSFYVMPVDGTDLENRKKYKLRIWIKTKNYSFPGVAGGGIYVPGVVSINTAEVLPKVKTDKKEVDLYLSNKAYGATFRVEKADIKAQGEIEAISFGDPKKNEKACESFRFDNYVKNADGSLTVHLKLQNGVSYGCNSKNSVKMYIRFKGQGTNTDGTPITMSVRINK